MSAMLIAEKLAATNKIITEFVYPPIPIRQFDWAAYRDPEGLVGYGETEADAIAALLELEGHAA